MKVKNISYPYPVLGNEDDVKGYFNPSFHHKLSREKILLITQFKLQNKSLRKLIKRKKAKFTVEVECNSTFFRTLFSTFNYSEKFEIKADKCRERVTVKFFIRATQEIKNYQIEECHEDYKEFMKNHPIDINAGDVLAVGGISSFIAEKEYDPMKPKVSSFIAVKEGIEENGPMAVDYNNPNRIVIMLSKNDWQKYSYLKSRKWMPPILWASIVLPVLADAIRVMEKEQEDVENYRWYNRIKTIMEHDNLPTDNPLSAAQSMLKFPLNSCFESIEQQDQVQEEDE